jgi:transcription antitermination protein NusB
VSSGGPGAAPPGTRAAARRRALDVLYEADLLGRPIAEVLARHRDDRDAGAPDAYAVELVSGVERLLPELYDRIRAAAEHWTVERMPLVDRNLLRLATYELVARPEVPTPVVLDQAIELAKLLSTADSGRFVNGVLGQVAREVRGGPGDPGDPGEPGDADEPDGSRGR